MDIILDDCARADIHMDRAEDDEACEDSAIQKLPMEETMNARSRPKR